MRVHPAMVSEPSAQTINLSWLLRLRWGAMAGQATTIAVVQWIIGIHLPLAPLGVIVGLEILSNLLCVHRARRVEAVRDWEIGGVLGLDVVFLTAILYLTGGQFNPFSFLYLVYVAQAAVVLPQRWTWGLAAMSFGCLGLLTWVVDPHALHADPRRHGEFLLMHVQGMWIAFGIAAVFIVYFVSRVTRALGEARSLAARAERLGSLATLATGAAHELSTPLSTIAIVAKELEGDLERGMSAEAAIVEARLIRKEVDRCREILVQMAADAGGAAGEGFRQVLVSDLLATAMDGVPERDRLTVRIEGEAASRVVYVPPRAAGQAIRGVLKNALQASEAPSAVSVRAALAGGDCRLEVMDEGRGMAPEVLARAGEPFFTTKEPGQGMGLGLFLTRVVLERLGGRVELSSSLGAGTSAILTIPLAQPATMNRTPPQQRTG